MMDHEDSVGSLAHVHFQAVGDVEYFAECLHCVLGAVPGTPAMGDLQDLAWLAHCFGEDWIA